MTGVVEKSGQDIINPVDFDNGVLLGYNAAKKIANVNTNQLFGTSLMVKAKEGADIDVLKDEVTGILRGQHRLKPKEKDDFSINELSILSILLDSFFSVLNFAGLLIGFFAILVGTFSVANIIEPGTFNPQDDATMNTPGVLMFAKLPGPVNGLTLFDDFYFER